MGVISYIELLVTFGLVTAVLLAIGTSIAWSIKPRRTAGWGVQTSGSTTHILPGEGHVEAEDCMCGPRVDGLPGALFVEHRNLRAGR